MKIVKMLLAVAFVLYFFIVPHSFAGGSLKFGIDTNGKHELSAGDRSEDYNVETGISCSLELFGAISNYVDLGGGIIYQAPRRIKEYSEADFNFMPIFGLVRIKPAFDTATPYLIAQLGYNLFDGNSDYKGSADLEGGLYYAYGAGILIKHTLLIELLYSENKGKISGPSGYINVKNNQFTINLGFNF